MPSNKILLEKQAIVSDLSAKMKNAAAGVLVDYKGITVEDDTKLRAELRKNGVEYSVVKNTLTKLACKEIGYEAFSPVLEGMTALAISPNDPVAAAKILCAYAKKIETFTIKAGFVDGAVLDAKGVQELSEVPPREVLLSRMVGSLNSPISGLAVALQAIIDKNGGSAADAVEAPAAQ